MVCQLPIAIYTVTSYFVCFEGNELIDLVYYINLMFLWKNKYVPTQV